MYLREHGGAILVLEQAKFLVRRQEGRDHYLSLNPAGAVIYCSASLKAAAQWKKRLKILDEFLQEETRTR